MIQCPLCQSSAQARGDHMGRQVLRCSASRCRIEFLYPQPTAEELRELYQAAYYRPGAPNQANTYLNTPPQVADGLVTSLTARLGSLRGLRILDFGAGVGEFATRLASAGGLVECVEPDPEAQRQLAQRGLRGYPNLDALVAGEPNARFDLITAIEVVEHLEDPVAYLQRLARITRPRGALFLSTPNFESLRARVMGLRWEQYQNPTHLFYFTYGSLAGALRAAGFANVWRLRTRAVYPSHGFARRLLQQPLQRTGLDGDLLVLAQHDPGSAGPG
ncbi:MAG: methyltransferase domain-containing protein [Gemmatimonadales bacterium]